MASTRRAFLSAAAVLLVLASGMSIDLVGADLVVHWQFDAPHVQNGRVTDLAGSHDAVITGPVRLLPDFSPGAILIDGERSRIAADGLDPNAPSSPLPRKAMTVEAWVAIDNTVEWGGIVGAVRAGGGDEQGWQLGFRQSSFSFRNSILGLRFLLAGSAL